MEKYLIYLLAGFAGGIIRGLVGFVKNKTTEAAAGFLADTEWQVSFLAGYAGIDFIESLYKIKIGKAYRI